MISQSRRKLILPGSPNKGMNIGEDSEITLKRVDGECQEHVNHGGTAMCRRTARMCSSRAEEPIPGITQSWKNVPL